VLLLNECLLLLLLLLLFIPLSTQSGNFWILPRKTNVAPFALDILLFVAFSVYHLTAGEIVRFMFRDTPFCWRVLLHMVMKGLLDVVRAAVRQLTQLDVATDENPRE
jgi:hypothetical protein